MNPPTGRPDGPLVTIIIPTYGQERFLATTIESALAQDYDALEVVVVDDASPDDTPGIAARYATEPRFRYVRHAHNRGRVATYRASLYEHARGAYVLNLDGDDWLSDASYVSKAMALVGRHPGLALVFARIGIFHETTGTFEEHLANRGLPELCNGTDLFLGFADGRVSIPHLTALYRRDLAIEVGFYRYDVLGSDSISFLLLLPGQQAAFVDRVVAVWRKHGDNASRTRDPRQVIANFAVADVPARSAAARSVLDAAELTRWRRRMSARLGYRSIAERVANGHVLSALGVGAWMLVDRPGAAADVVSAFGRRALRSIRRGRARTNVR